MNIQVFSQIFYRDTTTFNMPTRIPFTPRRVPQQFMILKLTGCKPQNKICLVLFILIFFSTTNRRQSIPKGTLCRRFVFFVLIQREPHWEKVPDWATGWDWGWVRE